MNWWRRFRSRDALEHQLDAELRDHLDRLVADHVAAGLPEEEARRRARLEFGGIEQTKEICRDVRGLNWIDEATQHLRYALRTFRRTPGFAAMIVGTLALAIGANTAIFSVAKAVVLTPLPFRDPDRVVLIFDGNQGEHYQPGRENILMTVRPFRFQAWREHCRSYEGMAIVRPTSVIVNVGDRAVTTDAFLAGEGYFELLGAPAEIGRTLTADDYGPHGGRVAVLSHRLWREHYNADPSAVGRDIVVDGAGYRIVGVMPRGYHPTRTMIGDDPQLWLPLLFDPATKYSRTLWLHNVYARLKPGVTLDQAQAELDVVEVGLSAANSGRRGYSVVAPVAGYVYGHHERVFWLLLLSVALVLMIACANVANLLLARAFGREREFAIRAALGASRGTIIRQVLIESLLMAGMAGAMGVALSRILTPPIVALLPATSQIPRLDQVQVDGGVLVFTLLISVFAGLLFGTAPALHSAGDLAADLKADGRGSSMGRRQRRLSDALIVTEVALALVLLTAGGLLVRDFLTLLNANPGFRPAQSAALRVTIPANRYASNESQAPSRAQLQALYDRLEKTVQAVPGVEAVGVTALLPLRQFWDPEALSIEGRPPLPPDKFGGGGANPRTGLPIHGTVAVQQVTPGYFAALGIRLVRGRLFDEHDRPDAPMVVLINESAARKFFAAEDPIGKRVTRGKKGTIVGVVEDTRLTGMDREVSPELFWPIGYSLPSDRAWIVARSGRGDDAMVDAVRRAIAQVDPELGIGEMTTMTRVLNDSLWQPRFAALLVGIFAVLAVLIATCGLYAVISYAVARRTHELGVRQALGATNRRIATLIIGHGLRVTGIGIIVGSLVAVVVNRITAQAVPRDRFPEWEVTHLSIRASPSLANFPWLLPAVAALLVALTIVACWMPVRRALAVDPIMALRME